MSLESFYGGKQGISPVIKASFKYITIEDNAYINASAPNSSEVMEECFKDVNYKDVWYGELCIINTTNKNNPNNGKIFRRTLKQESDETGAGTLYAEYVGTIVGPATGVPFISLMSIGDAQKTLTSYAKNDENDTSFFYPIGVDENNNIISSNERPTKTTTIQCFDASETNNQLIPGAVKDKDGNIISYNNTIKYTWVNIRENESGTDKDSQMLLGFQIPYPVFNINFTSVPYSQDFSGTKTSDDKNIFYHEWDLEIPRGVRGAYLDNVRLTNFNEFTADDGSGEFNQDVLYYNSAIHYDTQTDTYSIIATAEHIVDYPETETEKDIPFFAYDMHLINQNDEMTVHCYLGPYRDIAGVSLSENGVITITYSDASSKDLENKIKWIDNIKVDKSIGEATVTYNTISETTSEHETDIIELPFIESIFTETDEDTDTGKIRIKYTNDDNEYYIKDGTDEDAQPFTYKFVDGINIDNETQQISYHFTPERTLNSGVYLNTIVESQIDKTGRLLVLYSSSEKRPKDGLAEGASIQDSAGNTYTVTKDEKTDELLITGWNGYNWRRKVLNATTEEEQNVFWLDLGIVIKNLQGLKFFTEIDLSDYPDSEIIEWATYDIDDFIIDVLNKEIWDNGKTNPYYQGKIFDGDSGEAVGITDHTGQLIYTPKVQGGCAFYYDYRTSGWKFAGAWSEGTSTDLKLQTDELTDTVNNQYVTIPENIALTRYGFILIEKPTPQSIAPINAIWPTDNNETGG